VLAVHGRVAGAVDDRLDAEGALFPLFQYLPVAWIVSATATMMPVLALMTAGPPKLPA